MTELLLGASLGWAAGISPGPLLTLVLTTTLKRGAGAGMRVSLAPLITDPPIVAAGLAVSAGLSERFVTAISVAGGAYLVWLGATEIVAGRHARLVDGTDPAAARDVRRAVVTNLLSPHPWLFWVAVGGPLLVTAWQRSPLAGIFFIGAFYVVMIGTKVALALAAGRGRRHLTERWYRRLVQAGGVVLVALGAVLLGGSVG